MSNLKSQASIADSLNEGLRAARRGGKSYDYLAGEDDENRNLPPQKFAYHDAAPLNKHGKSFDYMDEDQNRDHDGNNANAMGSGPLRAGARRYSHYDSSADDSDVDSSDEQWVEEQLALHPIVRPPPRKTANPGPLGLLGFGMTTVLLNLHNTGHWPLYAVIPSMGICFGGGAQLIAGLLEFTKGNTFGTVAFMSYGAFWLSLVCVWMLPTDAPGVVPTGEYFLGIYLLIWGLFSFLMLCCTLRMNLAIFLVFLTVTILFFLLGGSHMAGNEAGVKAAGYEGIICGSLALYLGFAEIINEVWDRTVLPIVPMTQVLGWYDSVTKRGKGTEAEEKAE